MAFKAKLPQRERDFEAAYRELWDPDRIAKDQQTVLQRALEREAALTGQLGDTSYWSAERKQKLQADMERYQAALGELSLFGIDTRAEEGAARKGVEKALEFQNQFTDEADYNARYAYPEKYRGKKRADVNTALWRLRDAPEARAEYNWLKEHQYDYWAADELRAKMDAAEQEALALESARSGLGRMPAGSTDADYVARQQEAGKLTRRAEDSRRELERMRAALRSNTYRDEIAKWTPEMQKRFSGYGQWLEQTEALGTDTDEAAELGVLQDAADYQALEQYLKAQGYDETQLEGLRGYAREQKNAERRAELQKGMQQMAKQGTGWKTLLSAASVPLNMMGGLSAADAMLQKARAKEDPFTGEKTPVDFNSMNQLPAALGRDARGAAARDMSSVGAFFYNTGMSMADFALSAGLGGAAGMKALPEILLSGSAASAGMEAAKEAGGTDAQALTMGMLNGVAEAMFEHVSLDKLRMFQASASAARMTAKELALNVAKQAFVEGSEELCTTIANTISDAVVMADKSEINRSIEEYLADGMDEEEATRAAWKDWLSGLAQDFLGGALSGGVLSGGTYAASRLQAPRELIDTPKKQETRTAEDEIRETFADEIFDGLIPNEAVPELTALYESAGMPAALQRAQEIMGQEESAAPEGDARYSYGKDFSKEQTMENAREIQRMEPVANLEGTEFAKSEIPLRERVLEYLQGRKMVNPELGEVAFTKNSFRSNQGHGHTNEKITAYAAVPEVVENGKVIDYSPDHEGYPYDRITIAAPITITGEPYYMGVMVQRDQMTQRFYIHDVITEEKARAPFTTSLSAEGGEDTRGAQHLFLTNILQNAVQNNPAEKIEQGSRLTAERMAENGATPEMLEGEAALMAEQTAGKDRTNEQTARKDRPDEQNVSDDGGVGREPGTGAGRPGGRVPENAGGKQGQRRRAVAGTEGARILALCEDHGERRVSAKEIGIPGGTDSARLYAVKPEWCGERLQNVVRHAEAQGLTVTMVHGEIEIRGRKKTATVTGLRDGNHIWINVGARLHKGEALALHEYAHTLLDGDAQLIQAGRRALQECLTPAQAEQLTVKYAMLYENLYGGITEWMTEDEQQEVSDLIMVEVMCDALAEINRARAPGAVKATAAMREMLREETGVDVDAILNGETQTETAETETPPVREDAATAAVGNKGPTRYSIDENFTDEIDAWDGKTEKTFRVGTTSDALKSIGVKDKSIIWHSGKVARILREHRGMTKEIIKQVPEILENPVIVLQSKNSDSRLAIFGEVQDTNGAPVTAILELQPTNKGGQLLDMTVIASAYGKDSSPANFIRSSGLVYLDPNKNRTERWMQGLGLQLPSDATAFGSVGSVSYHDGKVKIESVPYTQYMQGNVRYSADEDYAAEAAAEKPMALRDKRLQAEAKIEVYRKLDSRTPAQEAALQELIAKRDAYKAEQKKRAKARLAEKRAALAARETTEARIRELDGLEERTPEQEAERKELQEKRAAYEAADVPNTARGNLRRKLMEAFQIRGDYWKFGEMIDAYTEKYVREKKLTQADLDELFDKLLLSGTETVPADEAYESIRALVRNGHIYVPESVVEEFGDDYEQFRKRAFANGIYLNQKNTNLRGIDEWTNEIANSIGLVDESADLKKQLETIVELAEEGKAENMTLSDMAERIGRLEGNTAQEAYLDELERKMTAALREFAAQAKIEMQLQKKSLYQQERQRQERLKKVEKQRARRQLQEMQQKTLKSLQWLKRNQNRAPQELREEFQKVLGDIDTLAVSAADEMHYSNKYNATWRDLHDMYQEAKSSDPNFLPSQELERIMSRLDGTHIADMDIDALQDLYRAATQLRTEYYNRNNVMGDELHRTFQEVYDASAQELKEAKKPKNVTGGREAWFNREQLNPINMLERMGGWNRNGTWYSMAKQLERGERDVKGYTCRAKGQLNDWLRENSAWVKKADGQGKDGIWYEVQAPQLMELDIGKEPTFGETVTVYMTPMQKVHMYLESRNYDNLRHMTGGRTFADRELYAKGKRAEAFAQGTTIRLAPETVKKLTEDLTKEEQELAQLLENYYNGMAHDEINRVSNVLYGYDRAMSKNYAPIFSNRNYTKYDPSVYDGTAESVGRVKERIKGAKNPSYNVSAIEAFEMHVEQTAKFVGMAIPTRNMKTLMGWYSGDTNMREVITHEWGKATLDYIDEIIRDLENPQRREQGKLERLTGKALSNYVSAVFGANPGIVLKQFASFPAAAATLEFRSLSGIARSGKVDTRLVAKYTPELDYRLLGYATPEAAELTKNPNWASTNKTMQFMFGGGAIIAMDGFTVKSLWPCAENYVRRHFPDIEMGSAADVENGVSPFYRKVAEVFNEAVNTTQPMYDTMHRSRIMQQGGALTRAFTMFKTVPMQEYNTMRRYVGEALYEKRTGDREATKKAGKRAGASVVSVLTATIMLEAIEFANQLLKNRGKRYRDDEDDELTLWSFAKEYGLRVMSDLAGVTIGGDELAEAIGNVITGDEWYGIEVPGGEQLNEVMEKILDAGKGMIELAGAVIDIAANDGDVSEYLEQNAGNILGGIRSMAETVSTYFAGVPVENVEKYLLGILDWISPKAAARYEEIWSETTKADLKGTEESALPGRIQKLFRGRNGIQDETAEELARLYQAGYTDVAPSDFPEKFSFSIEDENGDRQEYEIEMSEAQQQEYRKAWREAAGVDGLLQTREYRNAGDKEKAAMLKKAYDYATECAKQEMDEKYPADTWAETVTGLRDLGAETEYAVAVVRKLQTIESTKNADGESEGNSKLLKMQYIMDSKLTERQRDYLARGLASEEQEEKYDSVCADYVDFATYMQACAMDAATKGDKDEDGKTIKDSKAVKVLDYIDSMELTETQKYLIASTFYSDKTISKYTSWTADVF